MAWWSPGRLMRWSVLRPVVVARRGRVVGPRVAAAAIRAARDARGHLVADDCRAAGSG
ncbi:MAG: hypothetical protein ACRCTR_07065 [Actinomycetota bacterium]